MADHALMLTSGRTSKTRLIQFLLLILASASAGFAAHTMNPLQESMRHAFSWTDNQMALLLGPTQSIPVIVGGIPLGLMVDRYSRVRLVQIASLLGVTGSLLTALAPSYVLMFMARCMVGFAVPAMAIAGYSLLADHFPPDQRGRAKSLLSVGHYAGMSAPFLIGGWLLAANNGAAGWRWAMFGLAIPVALSTFVLFGMREPKRLDVTARSAASRGTFRELWHLRSIVAPLIVGLVMLDVTVYGVLTWAAPALTRSFHLPPDRVGPIMAMALMISGIAGPLSGGFIADACQKAGRPRRTLAVLCLTALFAAPGSLFTATGQIESAGVLLIIFVTVMSAAVSIALTLFTIVIPNDLRGLSLSVLTVANVAFALGLAPLFVSAVSTALGGESKVGLALAVVCAVANTIAAVAFGIGSKLFPNAQK